MKLQKTEEGINSAFYLGDALPDFLKELKTDFADFYQKTGIDPKEFYSPMYLTSISSAYQYHAARNYFGVSEIAFVMMILQKEMKGPIRTMAMQERLLQRSLGHTKTIQRKNSDGC